MTNSDRLSKLLALILFSIGIVANAQDAGVIKPATVEIHRKDNTIITGKLINISRDSATFRDGYGRVSKIAMRDIRKIDYVDSLSRQFRWESNPNTLRYLLSSTAYTLPKGDLTLESTYMFITSVHYGVSNRVTIGGGGDLFAGSVSFLNAKVNILSRDRHKFSAGLNYYRLPRNFIETYSGEDVRDLGLIYGASTWGNSNDHVTFGVGYMYMAKGFLPPVLNLSATKRISRRFGLVTENWFLFSGDRTGIPVLISVGARYISKRSTVDFAFYSTDKSLFRSMVPFISYCFRVNRQD
jgi:hypothetical protein